MASCPGNDVANDAALLPTNMAMADRLCTYVAAMSAVAGTPSQITEGTRPRSRDV